MFRARLLAKISHRLNTDEARVTVCLDGHDVTVSADRGGPISRSDWIIFEACGFSDEASALEYGEKLRTAVGIAGIVTSPAADTGTDTEMVDWGDHMKDHLPEGYHLRSEVHGLRVYSDDDRFLFASFNVTLDVVSSPAHYFSPMEELLPQSLDAIDANLRFAIRSINSAKMTTEPLARIVVAFATIERLASKTDSPTVYTRKIVTELLDDIGLTELKQEWGSIYGLRNKLFHGESLSTDIVRKLANRSITFVSKLVLTMVSRGGIRIPEIADVNVWHKQRVSSED